MGSFFDGKLTTVAWINENFPKDSTVLDVERYPEFSASLWNSGYYGYYHKGGANDNT